MQANNKLLLIGFSYFSKKPLMPHCDLVIPIIGC